MAKGAGRRRLGVSSFTKQTASLLPMPAVFGCCKTKPPHFYKTKRVALAAGALPDFGSVAETKRTQLRGENPMHGSSAPRQKSRRGRGCTFGVFTKQNEACGRHCSNARGALGSYKTNSGVPIRRSYSKCQRARVDRHAHEGRTHGFYQAKFCMAAYRQNSKSLGSLVKKPVIDTIRKLRDVTRTGDSPASLSPEASR